MYIRRLEPPRRQLRKERIIKSLQAKMKHKAIADQEGCSKSLVNFYATLINGNDTTKRL